MFILFLFGIFFGDHITKTVAWFSTFIYVEVVHNSRTLYRIEDLLTKLKEHNNEWPKKSKQIGYIRFKQFKW